MQTFLTQTITDKTFMNHSMRATFEAIARDLDNKRLHKQALEAWQIFMVITKLDPDGNYREPKGWVNHPAVVMWRGHEQALMIYIIAMCEEWKSRGFKTSIQAKAMKTYMAAIDRNLAYQGMPWWMKDEAMYQSIVTSHRQALLAKNYSHYKSLGWQEDTGVEPDKYDYVWPGEVVKNGIIERPQDFAERGSLARLGS